MADAASTLRTARAAVSEGLITEADYEVVKAAFLKAQQFKAGLDAGFISEADYAEVKTRFLDAFYGLHVCADGSGSGSATPQRPASPAVGQPSAMTGGHLDSLVLFSGNICQQSLDVKSLFGSCGRDMQPGGRRPFKTFH